MQSLWALVVIQFIVGLWFLVAEVVVKQRTPISAILPFVAAILILFYIFVTSK